MKYIAFNLIIDDIVNADGTTQMGILGGGGPQTAFGMRLWSDSVGLVAGVGKDFPQSIKSWLSKIDIDGKGLKETQQPTLRAWQVIEKDDTRTQVWRIPTEAIQTNILLHIENLPKAYTRAAGFHYGIHPHHIDFQFLESLKDLGSLISVEPFRPAQQQIKGPALRKFLELVDIFSPNLQEAKSYLGDHPPEVLLEKFLEAGAKLIVIRMGADGSLIAGENIQPTFIPAVPVTVVDTVGAGNAYCGGFLVGWHQSRDPIKAGLCGAVSASFLVEQIGLPHPGPSLYEKAHQRFETIQHLARPL
ncbi:MAG: hypothetical protein JEZ06_24150 [Anaerolineaceae bacterium]|nr:hypothetical protein [Anaerolineaceae bacterium]